MAALSVDENVFPQVEIGEMALTAMLSFCEQAAHLETGGILVGFYTADGTLAHVNEALGPPQGSKLTQTEFTRNTGLSKALQQRWPEQQYYLGEWHSHPRGLTSPSRQDRRQMAEIGNDAAYCCPNPILIIVARSRADWRVGVWVLINGRLVLAKEDTYGV